MEQQGGLAGAFNLQLGRCGPEDEEIQPSSPCDGQSFVPDWVSSLLRPMKKYLRFPILRCNLSFVAAMFALLCGLLPVVRGAETARDLDLYLLVGQSNMAGRGKVEPADKVPVAGIWMLDKEGAWVPAIDPVHFDRPERVGVGLARTFAATVQAARPQRQVGLIPCAVGGTRLDQWVPGGELYNDAITRAKIAMANGTLRGILWHQGESDCNNEAAANAYAENWSVMAAAFRHDLDASNVPIIVGALGDFLDRPLTAVVNAQLASLPMKVELVAFVSAAGLPAREDNIHFSTAAQKEFGRRYAQAFLSLGEQ